jgi:hypothetical protein
MPNLPGFYSYDSAGMETNLQLTEHDKSVGSWCQAVFEEAKDELEKYEEIVMIDRNINYLMGKQWVERRPSYKSAPVANRLWTNLIQLVSYLTDIRQTFEVKANNRLYDKHAKILNQLIKAWFFNEDIDMTMAMIIIHSALTIGYGRLTWNPDLMNGDGEFELTACGPMDVIPIRPGHNLQKALGVIYRVPKPLTWFQEKYPTKGFAVPIDREYSQYINTASSGAGQGMWGRAWQVLSPQMRRLFGQSASQYRDSVIPMALYREFWIRDNQKNTSDKSVFVGDIDKGYGYVVQSGQRLYPRGRLITMGGPVVLYDGPNPFWHGAFPFAALRLNRVPWQWPGVSEFRNQIPLQDVMNNILAGILDAVKKAVNPPLVSPDNAFSLAVKRNLDPNMPGAKVFYNPAAINPPQYAPTPALPGFVFQTMLYAQQELDAQSGFIDLSSVSRKGIVPAADTLEQMKEGQQTLVRLKVRYIEGFLKDIGKQFIPNIFQFYGLKRRIQMLGEDGKTFEDFDFDPGTMVPHGVPKEEHWRSFQFMIQPGSLLKSARIPQQMLMLNLRRMGDMDRDNMLEALDLGGLKESIQKNLDQEGKEFFVNMIRQKMSGAGGGGAVSPEVLKGLDSSPAGGGAPTPTV